MSTEAKAPPIEPLLTAEDVAAVLRLSVWRVHELTRLGKLPRVAVSTEPDVHPDRNGQGRGRKSYRYTRADVEAFIGQRRALAEPPKGDDDPGKPTPKRQPLPAACGGVSRLRRRRP